MRQAAEKVEHRERDHLRDSGVEGDNIKMDLQNVGWAMDWI
jgi:hypothetical protein